MSCKIGNKIVEWTISKEAINEINTYLFEKKEHGGVFKILGDSSVKINDFEMTPGDTDSVDVKEALVNLHTHPFHCYVQEETIYGWNSGEDIRECLLFALRGCIAHLVVAVEGTYIFQVNPCIVNSLINLKIDDDKGIRKKYGLTKNDFLNLCRGVMVYLIEIYFRSTHAFRQKTKQNIEPKDYVKFTNKFNPKNIFNNKKIVEGCGKLKCHGIPVGSGNMHYSKYSKGYEKNTKIMFISSDGDSSMSKYKYEDIEDIFNLVENIIIGNDCKTNYFNKWFSLRFYKNKITLKSGKKVFYVDIKDKVSILNEYDKIKINNFYGLVEITKDPKFYFYNLKGCDYPDIKKKLSNDLLNSKRSIKKKKTSKFSKRKNIMVYGGKNCPYTVKLIMFLDNNGIDYDSDIRENYIDIIRENDFDSVPQVYIDDVNIGGCNETMNYFKNNLKY